MGCPLNRWWLCTGGYIFVNRCHAATLCSETQMEASQFSYFCPLGLWLRGWFHSLGVKSLFIYLHTHLLGGEGLFLNAEYVSGAQMHSRQPEEEPCACPDKACRQWKMFIMIHRRTSMTCMLCFNWNVEYECWVCPFAMFPLVCVCVTNFCYVCSPSSPLSLPLA